MEFITKSKSRNIPRKRNRRTFFILRAFDAVADHTRCMRVDTINTILLHSFVRYIYIILDLKTRMGSDLKTTAVIPIFNEAKTIGKTISRVRPHVDEVLVVVAKRSSDGGLKIAERAGARTIIDNGLGKGAAMRQSMGSVTNGIILFIDADGSHIPEDIPAILEPIKKDGADMVIASRMLGGSEELYGTVSQFFRMLFSMIITLIINYRFNVRITDSQNGFRAIKTGAIKTLGLKSNIFDIETEMTMKCAKKGYRIVEVPSRELRREHGKSGINVLKMGPIYLWRVIANLF